MGTQRESQPWGVDKDAHILLDVHTGVHCSAHPSSLRATMEIPRSFTTGQI